METYTKENIADRCNQLFKIVSNLCDELKTCHTSPEYVLGLVYDVENKKAVIRELRKIYSELTEVKNG